MNSSSYRHNVLKGFLYEQFYNSKSLYIISACILLGTLLISIILSVLSSASVLKLNGVSNSGALSVGFLTACIIMLIYAIKKASRKEINSSFCFPFDRFTYTIGNFIMFAINSAVIFIITIIVYLLELIVFSMLSGISDRVCYFNSVTAEAFFIGLLISFLYVMFISAFTYLLFLLFTRYKGIAIVSFILIINIMASVSVFGVEPIKDTVNFYINERLPYLLIIKLAASAILCQTLSYLLMKKMEVKA